jgi:hypothetical protein
MFFEVATPGVSSPFHNRFLHYGRPRVEVADTGQRDSRSMARVFGVTELVLLAGVSAGPAGKRRQPLNSRAFSSRVAHGWC